MSVIVQRIIDVIGNLPPPHAVLQRTHGGLRLPPGFAHPQVVLQAWAKATILLADMIHAVAGSVSMTEKTVHVDRAAAASSLETFLEEQARQDICEANLAELFKPLPDDEDEKRTAYVMALLCLEKGLASAISPSELIPSA